MAAHIFLVGFSGSGKSTVGPLLAQKLNCQFIDCDKMIEKQQGCSIAEIFATEGETKFRQLEGSLVADICLRQKMTLVALGGGAFESFANRSVINAEHLSIYLKCSSVVIHGRIKKTNDRPLLAVLEGLKSRAQRVEISRMLKTRDKNYRKAKLTLTVTRLSPAQIATKLGGMIRKYNV